MNTVQNASRQAKKYARNTEKEVKPWVKWLARIGFVAKGVVYVLVGAMALDAVLGAGSSNINAKDAMVKIITQPYGQILLGLVAFGLTGYVIWRFVQASVDPENAGTSAKGIIKRIGYAVTGVVYAGLAVWAVQLIWGARGSGGGNTTEDWTARIMAQPFGRWVIAAVGVILFGLALFEFYRAYSAKFRKKFKLHEMSRAEESWATRIGRAGQIARGVVHGTIGVFFFQAAVNYDPSRAGGLGKALQKLGEQSYGIWVLGAVAVGLVCYGIYCFVLAKYRRIYW